MRERPHPFLNVDDELLSRPGFPGPNARHPFVEARRFPKSGHENLRKPGFRPPDGTVHPSFPPAFRSNNSKSGSMSWSRRYDPRTQAMGPGLRKAGSVTRLKPSSLFKRLGKHA
jgi:hypothetical protein